MAKTVYDIMAEKNARENISAFMQKMSLPYELAIDLNVPVPEVYGTIESDENGQLYTTKAQRTGCSMCGFGIQLEKRPHRFDRLRETNPKEWHFWMYDMGWGHVLDYIGIPWEDDYIKGSEQLYIDDLKESIQ